MWGKISGQLQVSTEALSAVPDRTSPITGSAPRQRLALALGLALMLLLAVASLSYGAVTISLDQVFALVVADDATVEAQIVREIRLPRVLTAIAAGAALGIGGVLMQALFRNPVADAWSLGLLAGGQLGVAFLVTAAAFAGPAAISFLTAFAGPGILAGAASGVALAGLLMLALGRRVSTITLLVIGLMLGFLAQGLTSVLVHFAARAGGRVFSGWNDGTFAAVSLGQLPILIVPILAGLAIAIWTAKPLTAFLLGETYAESLGANIKRVRLLTMAATVALVAPVTALCGPVTFIGLIVPHIARFAAGTARILPLLPLAIVAGAILALAGDFIVHLPWEQHFLHLNAVLAIVGAPVVILLLLFSPTMRGLR
jgi:iron complex transport system permease protein